MSTRTENLNPKVVHQLCVQVGKLQAEQPLAGIQVTASEDDPSDIRAEFTGPEKTPYEGGVFKLKLCICGDFPKVPPKANFITKIFHPNVDEKTGEVCVNTLKSDWQPNSWSIANILQTIRCLLIVPFPESALNEESGRLFMENYEAYCAHAKMLTRIHAVRKRSVELPSVPRFSIETQSPGSDEDTVLVSPKFLDYSTRNQSPFVGSPVKLKRMRCSIRRL